MEPQSNPAVRICPYCAEEIRPEAVVCRYCSRSLKPKPIWFRPSGLVSMAIVFAGLAIAIAIIFHPPTDPNQTGGTQDGLPRSSLSESPSHDTGVLPPAPDVDPDDDGDLPPGMLSHKQARDHIGEIVTIQGRIVGTRDIGSVCFLNFGPDINSDFTAPIFKSDKDKFPPNPAAYYLNKLVRVTGRIELYQQKGYDKPEIVLKASSQIQIVNESEDDQAGISPPPEEETSPIDGVISPAEARGYVGQVVTLEGVISGTRDIGKVCFLNFGSDTKRDFTAPIFDSDKGKFPSNPEDHYRNRRVRITGKVELYLDKGYNKPEIILKDQSQIEILN